MGKRDKDQDFDINQIPEDDAAILFNEDELSDEQEPDEDDSDNSSVDEDGNDDSQSDEDADEDAEQEEDDFSDLGLDEADDKSKTSKGKKIPDKFEGKSVEEIATAYTNMEKELGRLKNEIGELKKGGGKDSNNKDQGKNAEDDNVERVDLMQIFDVNQLNELILTSDKPGEVILQTIAKSFNALQEGAVKAVKKAIEDQHKTYQEKYFNEIDQTRAEKEAAKPFLQKAAKLAKKYGEEWNAVLPYMQKAIEKNPDLVKEPDDYEDLFERCRDWAKSRGVLQEIANKNHRAKKAGGFSATGRHKGGELDDDDQQAVLSKLLNT